MTKKKTAKKTAKKKVSKKTPKKKVAKKGGKKTATKKKVGKRIKAKTQSQVVKDIAEEHGLTVKQVKAIFETLREDILENLNPRSKKAPGVFTLPGICRFKTRKRPAKKARKGRNPFTGEDMMFKAKPASIVVKILPVKALKDEINGN